MSTSIIPYNVTLGSESPLFSYSPVRDGPATQGWNASYSGSTAYVPGADGVGTAFRHTENDGASFSVQFVGTAYWLCVSANGGTTYNFTENGHSLPTSGLPADSACSQWPGAKAIVGAGNQTYKSYTVGINITSIPNADASFDFYGAVLELSAGSTGMTTTPVTIDDTNPGWNYQPSPWLQADNPLDYNGTYSYSCTYDVGATATYTFNETTAVQLIGSPNDNTFGYSISFQGVESVYNATNLWHAYKQVLFMAGALDPSTTYSLTLSNYDPNQPDGPGIAGEQACTNLDALILMKIPSATSGNPGSSSSSVGSSPTSPSDQGGSSTSSLSSGAIAGVAIGAVAGVVIIILLLWLFLRRRAKATSIVPEPYPPMEETVDLVSPTTGLPGAPYPGTPYTPGSDTKASRNGYFNRPRPVDTTPELTTSTSYFQSTQQSPPLPPTSDATFSSRSRTSRSVASDPAVVSPTMLQGAATIDLVQVLNQRLRAEAEGADGSEAPPTYQDDR